MVSRQSTLAGLVLPVGLSLARSVGPAQMACQGTTYSLLSKL